MKTLFKLFAIAAAFGMAPAAALATAAPPATANSTAAAPADAAAAPAAAAPAVAAPPATAPEAGIGQPVDGRYGLPEQVTPIGHEAKWFHDWILVPLMFGISVFVLILLAWVMFRYRKGANPVPSRNTHNTTLEVVWTLVPVLILVAIAVPSIRLLAHQYDPPQADLTVKAIGNQWYWEYEYPDHNVTLVSNMIEDDEAIRRGEPRQLAVDNRMVVPVGAVVKVIVTSNDVIHAWGVPAFWVKIDAVPGRLNETWFRADRPGVYYGVCYELCGARHGYMPIAVEVVTLERFAQWIASRGGHLPGAAPAAAAPAAAAPAAPAATAEANTAATNQSVTQ